jgi:hypothetical protein
MSKMNTALTMQEWVETDFYEGLIKQPLWVMSAFGRLRDGEVLDKDDVRLDLIHYLVIQSMGRCPAHLFNTDTRHDYKVADFIRIIKAVTKAYIIKNYHKNEPVLIYDKATGIDQTDELHTACVAINCSQQSQPKVRLSHGGYICKNHICDGCRGHFQKTYPKGTGQLCEACDTHAYLQSP